MKILGVDIGGTSIKAGLMETSGVLSSFEEYPSFAKGGAVKLIDRVKKIIEDYDGVEAIGISTAGQVNRRDGSILYANENIPGYSGFELKKSMEAYFNVPVSVENDVNSAALGEKYFGNGKTYKDFLCLTYGTGIGGAVIINGDIYGGARGIAGEFGHIITHPGGRNCSCGKSGCYEMYASVTSLVSEASRQGLQYGNGRDVFNAFQKKDESVLNLVDSWIYEVAVGLVTVVHIFNPSIIIVGGGIMEQQSIVNQLNLTLKSLVMDSFSDVEIIPASLGNKAGVMGAISLHMSKK